MPKPTIIHPKDIGWCYQNSYLELPECFYTKCLPTPVKSTELVILNKDLLKSLGLKLDGYDAQTLSQFLSGGNVHPSLAPIALAYAGHQFGHFTMLGDGRAHLLGEHITCDGQRFDVQLKGSGATLYSRRGDGRAVLGPMLREYIISEAMHALNIPTTRSLSVITTGESVFRESPQMGAILTRVASSHLRVGTFELCRLNQDKNALKALADYAITRHYPELLAHEEPYPLFLKAVMLRQIRLIVQWLRVGFIHGVMNTDNMAISGETIDYGPCAFMDHYHPHTVFSAIDRMGRYAFDQQPHIALWNLTRFAETLLPLLDPNPEKAVESAEHILSAFKGLFEAHYWEMMRAKLGLLQQHDSDLQLIQDLLTLMHQHQADFTNTFYRLSLSLAPKDTFFEYDDVKDWLARWQTRLRLEHPDVKLAMQVMQQQNPVVIPRNHIVEKVLHQVSYDGDLKACDALIDRLKHPYDYAVTEDAFQCPPSEAEAVKHTYCGT